MFPSLANQQNKPLGAILWASNNPVHGNYLIDRNGRTVYIHTLDPKNTNTNLAEGKEEKYWIPVTVTHAMIDNVLPNNSQVLPNSTVQVKSGLMSNIPFKGEQAQVTYNGWPLYYYYQDNIGDTYGQAKLGTHFLIHPEGNPIINHAEPLPYEKDEIKSYQILLTPGTPNPDSSSYYRPYGLYGRSSLYRPYGYYRPYLGTSYGHPAYAPHATTVIHNPYGRSDLSYGASNYGNLAPVYDNYTYGLDNLYNPSWNVISYQETYTDYYIWRCWINFALRNSIDINNEQAYRTWLNSGARCDDYAAIQNSYNIWLTRPYDYDYNYFWNFYDFKRRHPNWGWRGDHDSDHDGGGHGGRGGRGGRGGNRGRGRGGNNGGNRGGRGGKK